MRDAISPALRAEVSAALLGSDYLLVHTDPALHGAAFRAIGRKGTPCAGIDVRFDGPIEAHALLGEGALHNAMPSCLDMALEGLLDPGVLGGYAAVRRHFRERWFGARKVDLKFMARTQGVREELEGRWMEGARLYVKRFWALADAQQAQAAD